MTSLLSALTVFILLWVAFGVFLRTGYGAFGQYLAQRHPSEASLILLLLMCLPLALSLSLTLALYFQPLGAYLIAAHCHSQTACSVHVPELPLAGIWAALIVSVTGVLFGRWWWTRGRLARALARQLTALAQPQGLFYLLPLRAPLAFTLGLVRPRIFLSRGLLEHCPERVIAAVIAHEQAHQRRGDNLRLLLAKACVLPFWGRWFKPLFDDLNLFQEMACDRIASHSSSPEELALAIVHVARLQQRNDFQAGLAGCSHFTRHHIHARVSALLGDPPAPRRGLILLVLGVLIAGLFTLGLDPLHHLLELP